MASTVLIFSIGGAERTRKTDKSDPISYFRIVFDHHRRFCIILYKKNCSCSPSQISLRPPTKVIWLGKGFFWVIVVTKHSTHTHTQSINNGGRRGARMRGRKCKNYFYYRCSGRWWCLNLTKFPAAEGYQRSGPSPLRERATRSCRWSSSVSSQKTERPFMGSFKIKFCGCAYEMCSSICYIAGLFLRMLCLLPSNR